MLCHIGFKFKQKLEKKSEQLFPEMEGQRNSYLET